MGDYNIHGLNPREFEHLVQALAIATIGPGITPFGDGPDGGREATFTGRMGYPSSEESWDGYLVIQAKFHTRPTYDTAKDGEWALSQLKQDLAKFENPKRNLPKPEYYLFVTNVVLTPKHETGSKDRASELLKHYQSLLGLKGWDIWDFDKLCRLLDVHEGVRRRYAAFISSGDILVEMMLFMKEQSLNFWSVISKFLQNEFFAEQFVKLEQAGHASEQKTSLGQVFVDLPAFHRPLAESSQSEQELEKSSRGIVSEILETGSRVLKRSSYANEPFIPDISAEPRPEPGRFVIVGGPGQGKSTVGQFVCQLYRAAILGSQPRSKIAPEVGNALSAFVEQCQMDKVSLPTARRFPVRVVLDQFANDLAGGKVKSLKSYILRRINYRTDEECAQEDVKRWLGEYPWLILLDGLDEVPATSNRKQVLEKIADFWAEAATLDADVLVVATTRPQGYSNDFSPEHYNHRYLLPLLKDRALQYASRLVTARYGNDPDRRDRILKRLKVACYQDTTQRLMRSPLQVTIMATLVDQIGQPPQERWRLFQQYYEVIYRREIEREIPASIILQQRKADVNAIHQRVGLFLQAESEKARYTESKLSADKFQKLVRARIAEEGHVDEQLELRTNEITEAALHRLVFLVGLEESRIGFEIRSLQEFMAAEALMDGRDEQVRMRLEAIASIAHWRNVFLFAAGKCFADRQFLRDMIVSICEELNDVQSDQVAGITLAGSRLALDILDDGVAREQPKYARRLLRIALRLAELPDMEANQRLAVIYESDFESTYRESIWQRFGQKDFKQKLGAWILLSSLAGRKIYWARELADAQWPQDPTVQGEILSGSHGINDWTIKKSVEIALKVPPFRHAVEYGGSDDDAIKEFSLPGWYLAVRKLHPGRGHRFANESGEIGLKLRGTRRVRLWIRNINDPFLKDLTPIKDAASNEPSWAPLIAGARFAESPNEQTLASELRWLSNFWPQKNPDYYSIRFGWPFDACLAACKSSSDLLALAQKAENGSLGDAENWLAAERRWKYKGVTEIDVTVSANDWPFNKQIADTGFPFACSSISFPSLGPPARAALWNTIIELYEGASAPARSWLAEAALTLVSFHPRRHSLAVDITPLLLKELISEQGRELYHFDFLEAFGIPDQLNEYWIEFFEWLGNKDFEYYFGFGSRPIKHMAQIAHAYTVDPSRTGLLNTLAIMTLSGEKPSIPTGLLNHAMQADDEKVRISATLIRISQGRWDRAEARDIAKRILNTSPQFELAYLKGLYLSNRFPSRSVDCETFAIAIRDEILASNRGELYEPIQALNERMRTRTSPLVKRKRWEELGLPSLL